MPRGGLRRDSQGTINHLFTPKWNNKKTTAIRIPEILKDKFLDLARYLDLKPKEEIIQLDFLGLIEENIKLKQEVNNYKNVSLNLENESQNLSSINDKTSNQNIQKNQQNKYQLAVECFMEFVEIQNLNVEELSKSRKGTKKHQLFEIYQWLNQKAKK